MACGVLTESRVVFAKTTGASEMVKVETRPRTLTLVSTDLAPDVPQEQLGMGGIRIRRSPRPPSQYRTFFAKGRTRLSSVTCQVSSFVQYPPDGETLIVAAKLMRTLAVVSIKFGDSKIFGDFRALVPLQLSGNIRTAHHCIATPRASMSNVRGLRGEE